MLLHLPLLLAAATPTNVEADLRKFLDVMFVAETYHADPVDLSKAVYQGAIPAMLRKLDPHSVFFEADQFEQLHQMETSLQKGFGTVVSILPGRVMVLQVLPDTPASRAGLSSGDEILGVNGIPLGGLVVEQIVGVLGEARQKDAVLYVRKPARSQLETVTLKPATMASPSVDRAFLLKPGIGYVRATSFENNTGQLLGQKIEELGGAQLQGLVLDLRGNPGGVMDAALQMASLFLKPDQVVVSVRGRAVGSSNARVAKDAKPYAFPIVVLIDAKTASASEIVTGALQDHDRAIIIGEPSYGKGLVQSVFPLSQGTGLALTTAFYYTPSGRSIQHPLRSSELEAQTSGPREEAHTDSGRIVRGGGGIEPDFPAPVERASRLRNVMEASGSFGTFAAQWLKTLQSQNKTIDATFQVPSALMDDFRTWLAERRIQPATPEWSAEAEWIRSRLRQEVFNLSLGVAKGDEIEMQRDLAVQMALSKLTKEN